ncbi:hypothetical protein OH76DRAFT_54348 [Lentinus brumalis]|uniref:Uncharacterized protein n=1 Tax=Lentinus brumalis TaxID=2498619 RepID=A0A371DYH4_9APHY|nr:hypothetical protein OH76DRAFT_54348 [Polyporus brumalis]
MQDIPMMYMPPPPLVPSLRINTPPHPVVVPCVASMSMPTSLRLPATPPTRSSSISGPISDSSFSPRQHLIITHKCLIIIIYHRPPHVLSVSLACHRYVCHSAALLRSRFARSQPPAPRRLSHDGHAPYARCTNGVWPRRFRLASHILSLSRFVTSHPRPSRRQRKRVWGVGMQTESTQYPPRPTLSFGPKLRMHYTAHVLMSRSVHYASRLLSPSVTTTAFATLSSLSCNISYIQPASSSVSCSSSYPSLLDVRTRFRSVPCILDTDCACARLFFALSVETLPSRSTSIPCVITIRIVHSPSHLVTGSLLALLLLPLLLLQLQY